MTASLPERPSLEYLRKRAKELLKAHEAGDASSCRILRRLHRFVDAADQEILAAKFTLKDVQFALAMEYGFKSWANMKAHVELLPGRDSGRRDYSEVSLRGNGHSDDAFSLTFAAVADLLGRDAPYEEVFPLSVNPFAPAFYLPELCPSFWHQRGRSHGLDILCGRFGLRSERIDLPETDIHPISEAERFRTEHLTKVADILRDALQSGWVVLTESGWAAADGGGFVSWLWPGIVEEARSDGLILGATLNGRHDNYVVDPGPCWALSASSADLSDAEAQRTALELAVHRIRGDCPPFEAGDGMTFGLAAMEAWVGKMDHVPFCEACVESAPDSDRARGWSCARDCATSVCAGAATASAFLRTCSASPEANVRTRLQEATGRYEKIERLLRPFTTWEEGKGYHAMMGNLQEQKQHARAVLQPISEELTEAASAMEGALTAMP